MAQYARPDSDITVGNFSPSVGATLYGCIDEATRDDLDYISSQSNALGLCEVGLSNVADPQASTGHVLRYAYCRTNTVKDMTMVMRLMQGTTTIASWTYVNPSDSGVFQPAANTLTAQQADAITDYTDLRLQVEVTVNAGGGNQARVSWVEFEVPDAQTQTIVKVGAETGGITEAAKRRALSARAGSEVAGLAEVSARRAWSLRILAETVGLADHFVRSALGALVRLMAEAVGISDVAARRGWAVRPAIEAEGLVGAGVRSGRSVLMAAEVVGAVDAFVRSTLGALVRLMAEVVGGSDVGIRRLRSARPAAETEGLIARKVKRAWMIRPATEAVGIAETLVKWASGALVKLMAEALGLLDVGNRRVRAARATAEIAQVADVYTRRSWAVRILAEAVGIVDRLAFWVPGALIRMTAEAVGISDVSGRRGWGVRAFKDAVGVVENGLRRAGLVRLVSEVVALGETAGKRLWSARRAAEAVGLRDAAGKRAWSLRIFGEVVGLVDAGRLTRGFVQILTETVGILGTWAWVLWQSVFRGAVELDSPMLLAFDGGSQIGLSLGLTSSVTTVVELKSTIWDL